MATDGLGTAAPDLAAADAFARGDWQSAIALLRNAGETRSLGSAELDLLARAAYAAGELETAITAWERLYAESTVLGDVPTAAATATTIAMYLLMDTGLMAPVRGWLSRANRLLAELPESPAHALAAMVHTYERFFCGDMDASRHAAASAIELGIRQGAPLATALARTATARLMILDGDVGGGLGLLDEVAVTVMSGELDALGAGMVYCELICAMQGLAQYDRAEQWTDAMDRWRVGTAYGGINGRCRVHRAEILRLRGHCADAEDEALHACEELRPWMRREYGWPLTELGTIRLRRGDLAGAEEALLAAHEHGWEPQPSLALLRLAQGDVVTATALIRDALDYPLNPPSKERPPYGELRRAPLLEAYVEIALAAADLTMATAAAAELTAIADRFASRALAAAAALACGRVALATGDAATAVDHCGTAVAAWSEIGAPYETSTARLVLAEALLLVGRQERARLEECTARAALERIGARLPASTPTKSPAEAVFRCDGDTRTISFAGHTVLLRDLKGMRYLSLLLAQPQREFHVFDLLGVTVVDTDTGPVIDEQARAAYKRRLAEIEDDIDEATQLGDATRAALAEADRDYLVRELSHAYGLRGQTRRPNATSERARASVTRALRYAIDRIATHHTQLGDHLERTVRTGTYCSYTPDPRTPMTWQV
jgi:tetratricopeptide (TPR) repeat protein